MSAAGAKSALGAAPAPPPVPEWNSARQELVQMLWGKDFSIPGEADYILNLVKPFGLTKENSMLEIGAGLGGGAPTVAGEICTYVEGFDLNADLVKWANELSMMSDLGKKAAIKPFDPETLDLRANYYDAALLRETLTAIDDEAIVIEKILAALKPRTSIVIADFFLPENKPCQEALAALRSENRAVFPGTVDPVIATMESLDFELRVDVDETVSYAEEVWRAWAGVAKRIADKPGSDDLSDALMWETELWRLCNNAFEACELQMRRIVGSKKSQMSDACVDRCRDAHYVPRPIRRLAAVFPNFRIAGPAGGARRGR
ncbi:MAG: methyltransferase domain-containing protein [Alphaproteobacteria bacterium]